MSLAFLEQRARHLMGVAANPPQRPSLLTVTAAVAGVAAIANMAAVAAPPPASDTPTRLGTSIAQSMRDRDRALADRNRALDLREQATRAAEQRLRSDIQANQSAPVEAGPPPPDPQDTMFDNLARIYQTMKPNRAAPIFEKLAIDVQVQVAKRMRERQTALIMAAMTPDSAVELSMALAGRQIVKAPPRMASQPRLATPRQRADARQAPPQRQRGAAPIQQAAGAPAASTAPKGQVAAR